jgi:hypothetical protein
LDFEKLGSFYLGKEYDLKKGKLLDQLVMYDARDLTTHAICVGMTGSGKTGLCLCLLEEAAIDHVPAIIIDPKGDMTNLLLTFPELRPEDFRPWINVDDAQRKGLSEDQFAAQQADMWSKGLADWGQDKARIKMLRDSTDFVIYTPGSNAGVPVSILQSFAAPALSWETDSEFILERIQGTVSALLGLIGIDADPVRSREHILLANLFQYFWRQGQDLDLAKLILAIQNPPISQLGVLPVDTFFPQKDRFELAISLNNIIAAPGFQSWLKGSPLDAASFFSTPDGKPRHSVFYIAHLSDRERMFFVTMLLNQVITWMRAQPGTTSLRALLYMDEIFGYFPPVANPPSKQPMLTLLKQARAFGLGVVLTTQNPVDLDYKGLTNAGTWLIGRLQAERDKIRLLEGLESATSVAGNVMNRGTMDRIISSLANRVFLLHNVHEDAPVTFQSRWAMSYLRGPLTKDQIHVLMNGRQPDMSVAIPIAKAGVSLSKPAAVTPALTAIARQLSASPPVLPSEIQQVYLPTRRDSTEVQQDIEKQTGGPVEVQNRLLLYVPAVLGIGRIRFADRRLNVDTSQDFALLAQPLSEGGPTRWEDAQSLDLTSRDLLNRPEPEARFDQLPDSINEARELGTLKDGLIDHLYHNISLKLLYSSTLKTYSQLNETERDFRMRMSQSAREKRDEEVDKLNQSYETRLRTLHDRLRRAQTAVAMRQADAEARKREVVVSAGESVLGMFLGRRSMRSASTALSKYRQKTAAEMRAQEAADSVETLQKDIDQLEGELRQETTAITARWDDATKAFDEAPVRPARSDIEVQSVAVAWAPNWQLAYRDQQGNVRTELLKAY